MKKAVKMSVELRVGWCSRPASVFPTAVVVLLLLGSSPGAGSASAFCHHRVPSAEEVRIPGVKPGEGLFASMVIVTFCPVLTHR
ncbi:UNVERIFIED_CONTAM: hypothetical protein K2H54_023007 [Gekko kuhli]